MKSEKNLMIIAVSEFTDYNLKNKRGLSSGNIKKSFCRLADKVRKLNGRSDHFTQNKRVVGSRADHDAAESD
jgi:hypothetical protein